MRVCVCWIKSSKHDRYFDGNVRKRRKQNLNKCLDAMVFKDEKNNALMFIFVSWFGKGHTNMQLYSTRSDIFFCLFRWWSMWNGRVDIEGVSYEKRSKISIYALWLVVNDGDGNLKNEWRKKKKILMEKCSSVRGRKEKTRNGTQKKKKFIVVFLFLFFFGFFLLLLLLLFFFLFFFHVFVVFYMFLHWRQATIRFSMHACIHAHILALFFGLNGRTMVLILFF